MTPSFVAELADLGDGLDDANFVGGVHDADEDGLVGAFEDDEGVAARSISMRPSAFTRAGR